MTARTALLLAGGLGLVLLAVLPPVLPTYVVILLTESLIAAIAAGSLDLLIGYTGLASLGHAAFFAVGAYATGILVTRHAASFGAALVVSVVLAALVSAAIAFLALRATGLYFMMITLSVSMCAWGLAYRWVSLTGCDTGVVGITRPRVITLAVMRGGLDFYYLVLAVFVVCLVLFLLLIASPFGKTLVGIRDSESRMRVLGYNVWLHKYLAFVLSGTHAGFAGMLWAYYNGFVSPADVQLLTSVEVLLMVALGGPGTLAGPAVGAVLIVFLKNFVSVYTRRWLLILGTIYIVSILFAPRGLVGLLRRARA